MTIFVLLSIGQLYNSPIQFCELFLCSTGRHFSAIAKELHDELFRVQVKRSRKLPLESTALRQWAYFSS